MIVVPLVAILAFALFSTTSGEGETRQVAPQADPVRTEIRVHKTGETVRVGYTTYTVTWSWWWDKLSSNPYLNRRPDAAFLNVVLSVRNDDTKARSVPLLHLVDETGAQYDPFAGGSTLEGSIDLFTELNPGVTKRGRVVFDAPKEHTYKLLVSGGYWSGENALIELEPTTRR